MAYECLKACDGRKRGLLGDWELWLRKADELYLRFLDRVGDSPFAFHEVASVGFLASASAMAGYLPMNEYDVIKRGRDDKRFKVPGRADLWFDAGRRCYSFEFKRAWLAATARNLKETLAEATRDISRINRDEYHYSAGGLLTRIRDPHRLPTYRAFWESDAVDIAYRIGPDGVDGGLLFFSFGS